MQRWLYPLLVMLSLAGTGRAADPETRVFELRSYKPNPGKQAALNDLIATSAVKYMAKHQIEFLGAWVPADPADERVLTLVAHADRDSARKNWPAFQADPGWREELAAASKDGRAVDSITSYFLTATDYSPAVKPNQVGDRVFELRTYITTPKNLPNLNARFRNHTLKLFEKHGMTNIAYFNLHRGEKTTVSEVLMGLAPRDTPATDVPGETTAEDFTLVYFLTHPSADAMKASFASFRDDPAWKAALADSEKNAGGPLTAKNGVKSLLLKPTRYSPWK